MKDARHQARAVLVFPTIVKAGFLFGAQYGEGALRRKGATAGDYNSLAASYGYQVGRGLSYSATRSSSTSRGDGRGRAAGLED